ncbi:MAG: DUF5661 family protein [Candidatus Saccharibacteria bacterium]|nr:DUF5661 family protein [Candidatus Saccharibacteria bacterium]
MNKVFTDNEARNIGEKIGVDFARIDLKQFRAGLKIELEHGLHDPETDVTGGDVFLTGKIAWAHLKEIPDYYTRLEKMESEAES